MAEVLGVFASGVAVVQISTQVGDSILQLKRLWDDVRNVPDTINHLMSQIEHLSSILADLEGDFSKAPTPLENNNSVRHSMEQCRKATESLHGLVQDLSSHIKSGNRAKRGLGRVKVVLKKDLLAKYEARLWDAVRLLNMSQWTYDRALLRLQPSLIVAELESRNFQVTSRQLPSSTEFGAQPTDARYPQEDQKEGSDRPGSKKRLQPLPWRRTSIFGQFMYQCIPGSSPGNPETNVYQARFVAPFWLARKAWDFQAYRAQYGWDFLLRPYYVIPSNSPVFEYAQDGRLLELLSLFSQKLASPFDRDPEGATVLQYAAIGGTMAELKGVDAIARYQDVYITLLDMGLSALERSDYHSTALEWLGAYYCRLLSAGNRSHRSIFRNLLSRGCYDEYDSVDNFGCWATYRRAISPYLQELDLFESFINRVVPDLYDRPASERADWLIREAGSFLFCVDPMVFAKIVSRDSSLSAERIRATQGGRHSFLHALSFAYGQSMAREIYPCEPDSKSKDWEDLMRRVAATVDSEDLHTQFREDGGLLMTPMFFLMKGCLQVHWSYLCYPEPTQSRSRGTLLKILRRWLNHLMLGGIDLVKFGRAELRLFRENSALKSYRWKFLFSMLKKETGPILVKFTYGPRPEDWTLEWDMQSEEFAGDFWEIVENPPLRIPGAWEDDF